MRAQYCPWMMRVNPKDIKFISIKPFQRTCGSHLRRYGSSNNREIMLVNYKFLLNARTLIEF